MHIKQISKKEKYLWILMISIIDYISYVFFCIYWININNYINTWGFTITFMSLFSYKILKKNYIDIIIFVLLSLQ